MFDFDSLSKAIARQTVLCIGDLMLDEFVYGEVTRISPEAPAPVIAVQRSETNIGGAGNVARNIAALGAPLHLRRIDRGGRRGRPTESAAFAGKPDRKRAGWRSRPADDAKSALRVEHFSTTCCARTGNWLLPRLAISTDMHDHPAL